MKKSSIKVLEAYTQWLIKNDYTFMTTWYEKDGEPCGNCNVIPPKVLKKFIEESKQFDIL